jgi:3-oxoacyl-[acyl-carrier-protein] synthase-3
MRARIAGLGHHAPDRRVTSAEIEARLGLSEGWIARRTGIRERRFAADGQAATDLAFEAARAALGNADIAPSEVKLLILATSTPDHPLPPSAPLLAHRLGCGRAGAMDLAGACAGFLYGLSLADSFVRAHGVSAIVAAANILSRRIGHDDAATASLFADAGGAAVLTPCRDEDGAGVLAVELGSNGALYDLIKIEAGGSRKPYDPSAPASERLMRISDGPAAFAAGIESMARTSRAALENAAMTVEDIDWWVPHQANERLLEAVRKKIGLPSEKALYSFQDYGNSSAATIPLTLSLFHEKGVVRAGQIILFSAVGAGFTEGAMIVRL